MRKDIRKRLERALITLQEPGGSTIRSIIKVINKESPILSLRKVLEALQEGINEGFLCMYNGRFKLKQQVNTAKNYKDKDSIDDDDVDVDEIGSEDVLKKSDIELNHEESELSSDEESVNIENDALITLKKNNKKNSTHKKHYRKNKTRLGQKSHSKVLLHKKSFRYLNKSGKKQEKPKYRAKMMNRKPRKLSKEDNIGYDSLLQDVRYGENKILNRTLVEKPDIKKQRGPRCTSMKKDVRMPSKVHIPFVPPLVPQRNSTINELLRRSPEPVNGPLYDSYNEFTYKPNCLEYFGAYS